MHTVRWPPSRFVSSNLHRRIQRKGGIWRCSALTGRAATTQQAASVSSISRRLTLLQTAGCLTATSLLNLAPTQAFTLPPAGYRLHVDKLDGYYFLFPSGWSPVTTSGNDVFYRDPVQVDSNIFVDVSSPSSSRYKSITDLGTPEDAAQRLLNQYLYKEFMSTRLGIRREGKVISCGEHVAPDGKVYYNIDIELKSYGSKNPYVVTQQEIMDSYGLEWQRRLVTVLGVSNTRLYEFRLQADSKVYEQEQASFIKITDSFRCKEVESK